MEIEILFFVSLATEKIPDFKTLQFLQGLFCVVMPRLLIASCCFAA
jgi:hypothetical protein